MDIKALEADYKRLRLEMHSLSDEIMNHLHSKFDAKLNDYKSFDGFLDDINNYAEGDTFGKLMYIKYASNIIK